MHPTLFTLHLLEHEWNIMSYSFFYVCAIVFVIIASMITAVRGGFKVRDTIFMISSTAFSGLIGARIGHFALNASIYTDGNRSIFDLHMTGFTIVGGLIFAVVTGFVVGGLLKIDVWRFADCCIPYVAFGIVIARVGCYLNGCCFGHVTDSLLGVQFPLLSEAHKFQMLHGIGSLFSVSRVHPTQLYELVAALFGGIIAFIITQKKNHLRYSCTVFWNVV